MCLGSCVSVRKNDILGGFNCDLLLKGSKLSSIFKNNRLVQILDVPTRLTFTSATLLDLIKTNNRNAILAKSVVS